MITFVSILSETIKPEEASGIERYFHAPFGMVLFGLLVYFAVKWGFTRKQFDTFKLWAEDQKDELILCLLLGMGFVIYDSQLLAAINDLFYWLGQAGDIGAFKELRDKPIVFKTHHYFLVGPIVEGFYWFAKKFSKK